MTRPSISVLPARTSVRAGARRPVASGPVRRVLLLFLVPALGVVAGCQARATVAVDVQTGGAGTVTVTVRLDKEATTRLGDPKAALSTADLAGAGWKVLAPVTKSGAATFTVVRPYRSPAELATVLDEVGGKGGVFRGTKLAVGNSFASTTYDFRTTVHLTGSLDQLSDPEVAAALGNLPLGRTAEELVAEGATAKGAATLTLDVELPGAEPVTWTRSATGGKPSTVVAATSSRVWTWWPLALAGLGLVLVVAGIVVGVRSRRSSAPAEPASVEPAPAPPSPAPADPPPSSPNS